MQPPPHVLITGARGQVGSELSRGRWPSATAVTAVGSTELDITDRDVVMNAVVGAAPDVIVNAAAYTAVDRAESEPERAFAVNATGVAHLAEAADAVDALLIHVSTDYVFDGAKSGWYVESDSRNPLGVYGASKSEGEDAALTAERSLVLRTAWVYGALGSNFVSTMLRLAGERDELGVVDDQVGCPTAAGDVARAIIDIINVTGGEVGRARRGADAAEGRVFHVASPSAVSWFEFANLIFDCSSVGFDGRCCPLSTAEYPSPAARPANSRLDSSLLAETFGVRLPEVSEALGQVVAELEQR